MSLAIWRPARRTDRGALSVFECAKPAKPYKSAATGWKLHHPRIFEYDAQQKIRGLAPKVPAAGPLRVYVVEDDSGIAAVVSWREVGGPAEVHLDVIGVAPRYRRQGGDFAREVVTVALIEIESAAVEAGADELYVEGEIHCDNDASLKLFEDKKFGMLEEFPTGAQTWSIKVPIGGAEVSDDELAEEDESPGA